MKLSILAYKLNNNLWAFDHEHNDTTEELLCNGTENVIDWYFELMNGVKPLPGNKINFYLDTNSFECAITQIKLIEINATGSVYKDELSSMKLWLCPWLQGYFGTIPEIIYVYCEKYEELIIDLEFEKLLYELICDK